MRQIADLLPAGVSGSLPEAVRATLEEARARVREAEAERVRALGRLEHIVDTAPNGWVVVDASGRIERINQAARSLLDLRREPVGLTPLEGLHAPEVIDAVAKTVATGEPTAARDFALADRDLSVSTHPLQPGVLAVIRDVSNERALDRARTEFVANVSHELRTPIAAILGYAETLLSTPGGLNEDVAWMTRTIQRNGERLRDLFDDLMQLYKLEARRRGFPTQPLDIGATVRDAVGPARDAATAKGLGFAVLADPGLVALASPQALSTLVLNLASNAVKYTPEGRVALEVVGLDHEVQVRVRDTGIGIPKAHHERVFERFYRVDEGRARDVGGTGLGLAIVKHLAEASGCRVSLESEEGKGSTFTVHLPRLPGPKPVRTWDVTLGVEDALGTSSQERG